jgi:hypothetical protein
MQAFRLTADSALLFFELCHELNANTEPERLQIMAEMIKLGKVEQVTYTTKTKEEYIKHLQKHFTCAIVEPKTTPNKENTNG